MSMSDEMVEAVIGSASIASTVTGLVLGQLDPAMGGTLISLVTQFGGLGLAVWLVYHHTTKTIPEMQKLHREERLEAIDKFNRELDVKRNEYLASIKHIQESHQAEIVDGREELVVRIVDAVNKSGCKWNG